MARAKEADTVQVHYTGKLEDGSVFDTSRDREPLEFTIGEGQVIRGFEAAVTGMEPGETKTATVAPQDAYGDYRDEMAITVDRSRLPDDLNPTTGQRLTVQKSDGEQMTVRVTDVSDSSVTLDANHVLAGRQLVFELQLVQIL